MKIRKSLKAIFEKIDKLEPLTDSEKMEYIRYSITEHNDGEKMESFSSISTSALCNVACTLRAKNPNYICSKCYARNQLKRYKTLSEKMARNTVFYTNYTITPSSVPFINETVFRLESFGEIQSEKQLKNYFTIARKNKHCFFVLWSKEIARIAEFKQGTTKPGNFRIIASEYVINNHFPYDYLKIYPFVDKVFSTYTKDFAAENDIEINCSGKCSECMKCYDKKDKTPYHGNKRKV